MAFLFQLQLINLHFVGVIGLGLVEQFESVSGFGGHWWFFVAVEKLLFSPSALVVAR